MLSLYASGLLVDGLGELAEQLASAIDAEYKPVRTQAKACPFGFAASLQTQPPRYQWHFKSVYHGEAGAAGGEGGVAPRFPPL